MSVPLEPEARLAAARCIFGSDRSSLAPAQFEVALYDGLPGSGTAQELPAVGGYAAVLVDNDDDLWPVPEPGAEALVSVPVWFNPTGDWPVTALWRVLRDPVTGFVWHHQPLSQPIDVEAGEGGSTPAAFSIVMTVAWSREDVAQ